MTLLVGDCDVAVSGTIGSGNLAMIVDVKVGGGTLQVKVDYKGTKLAGTESTEAKILSFTSLLINLLKLMLSFFQNQ